MATKKRTKTDVIIQWHINRNPQNFLKAFEDAATELDSDAITIKRRWYSHTKKLGTVMSTNGGKAAYPNTKNVWRGYTPVINPVKGLHKHALLSVIDSVKK